MTRIDWAVMDKHSRVAKCKRHCFPLKIGSELAAVCMKFTISHEEVEGRGVRRMGSPGNPQSNDAWGEPVLILL